MSGEWHIEVPSRSFGIWHIRIYNDNSERYVSTVYGPGMLSTTAAYADDVSGKTESVRVKSLDPKIRGALEAAYALAIVMMDQN